MDEAFLQEKVACLDGTMMQKRPRKGVAKADPIIHHVPWQRLRAHKMIVRAPPLQMGQQVWGLLSRRPGAASKGCHSMADGQIDSLNESRIESSREA
jgi:hypothetical protein